MKYSVTTPDGCYSTKTKEFDGTDAANAHAEKLIAQKTGKGYTEK